MTTAKLDPFTTAGGMLRALAGRQVSAVELLELHLVRIARHDRTLNAIATRDFQRARRQAEAADTARAGGLLRRQRSQAARDRAAAQRPVPLPTDAERRRRDGRAGAARPERRRPRARARRPRRPRHGGRYRLAARAAGGAPHAARRVPDRRPAADRSEEHTSELQSPCNLVCRLLL